MKTANHPTGITINFDASKHLYTDSRGLGPYDSVTRVVSSLFAPFDVDGSIASRVASREGRTVSQVKASWAATGDKACALGTRVHETSEAILLGLPPPHAPTSPRERAAFAAAFSSASQIRATCSSVHPEAIIADPASLTAGTCDLLAIRRRDSAPILLDWKTNKHIDATNAYGARALPPYSHLHDCHLVRYSLQLHIYASILRMHYLRADEADRLVMVLVHLAPDNPDPQWLEVLDLRREAELVMMDRRRRVVDVLKRVKDAENAEKETEAAVPHEFMEGSGE